MPSITLEEGLRAYDIGAKVRALRQRKGLGVVQLGQHSGLSAAMISKIERGQIHPTLPTLLRIALVFGVGLEHFFVEVEGRPDVTVVRRKERLRLPVPPGADAPPYLFESLNYPVREAQLDGYLAVFPATATASAPHAHSGAELIYLTAGALEITTGTATVLLGAGDAAYLEPKAVHSYRNAGNDKAEAVVVVRAETAR